MVSSYKNAFDNDGIDIRSREKDATQIESQVPNSLFDFDELDELEAESRTTEQACEVPLIDTTRWLNTPLFSLLVVSGLTGQELCIVKGASRTWRVDELKDHIEKCEGTLKRAQQLIFNGKLAIDQEVIGDLLINSKNEVALVRSQPLWSSLLDQIKSGEVLLEELDESARNDKALVLAAIRASHGRALAHASFRLKADKQVVLEAVRRNGVALRHASESRRSDRDVVLAAIREWPLALQFADNSLQSDFSVAIVAVRKNSKVVECLIDEFRRRRDFAIDVIVECPYALPLLPAEFLGDREFVLAILRRNGEALHHACEWKHDKEVVLIAVQSTAYALAFAGVELFEDLAFMKAILDVNPKAFRYFPKYLRGDWNIALKAAQRDSNMISFAHPDMQKALQREITREAATLAGVPEYEGGDAPVPWLFGIGASGVPPPGMPKK